MVWKGSLSNRRKRDMSGIRMVWNPSRFVGTFLGDTECLESDPTSVEITRDIFGIVENIPSISKNPFRWQISKTDNIGIAEWLESDPSGHSGTTPLESADAGDVPKIGWLRNQRRWSIWCRVLQPDQRILLRSAHLPRTGSDPRLSRMGHNPVSFPGLVVWSIQR